jgi:D-glycero-alpha-D-manno-heptose 1-phosphate guanylyltransferase
VDTIILAGGLGTRLRSVVSHVPKPLAPVAGRPFLEHLMDRWIAQGATRFVLSVGYRHELIEAHFGSSYRSVPVSYAVERNPLGTGGGLLLGLQAAGGQGTVAAINGDTFFAVDVAAMRRFHQENKSEFTMAVFAAQVPDRYATVKLRAGGRIEALNTAAAHGSSVLNGGVYLMERGAILKAGFDPGERVSLEDALMPAMLDRGARVFGFLSDAPFIDIGEPKDYARAPSVIAAL